VDKARHACACSPRSTGASAWTGIVHGLRESCMEVRQKRCRNELAQVLLLLPRAPNNGWLAVRQRGETRTAGARCKKQIREESN